MNEKNFMRFWQFSENESGKIHRELGRCLDDLEEFHKASRAEKENFMKTDIKVINNFLNFVARARQAESGIIQAMAVMGERQTKSDDYRNFIKENVPNVVIPQKQLKK